MKALQKIYEFQLKKVSLIRNKTSMVHDLKKAHKFLSKETKYQRLQDPSQINED
jgi:hypothetical protein